MCKSVVRSVEAQIKFCPVLFRNANIATLRYLSEVHSYKKRIYDFGVKDPLFYRVLLCRRIFGMDVAALQI